jgi:predicted permease
MADFLRDLQHAVRRVRRRPALLAAATALLATAVGGGTALFALIDAAVLEPLPLTDERSLVSVYIARPETPRGPLQLPLFLRLQSDAKSFSALAAYFQWSVNITGDGDAERVQGMRVSSNYFDVVGAGVGLGRPLRREDAAGDARIALISDGFWTRRFGADPDVVGRQVILNGERFTIAGVLRPDFPFQIRETEVIAPWDAETDARRANPLLAFLRVTGRLAPGVSITQAQADFDLRLEEYRAAYPQTRSAEQIARVVALREDLTGSPRSMLWLLSAGMALVLLIAAANLSGLLFAELTHRRREFAMRRALGATGRRVAAQLTAEALVFTVAGLASGLIVARLLISAVVLTGGPVFLSVVQAELDAKALLFAVAAAAGVTLTAALLPLFSLSRTLSSGELWQRGGTGRARWARRGLAGTEVALSVLLLVVAGLLLRSFTVVQRVDPGFESANVLTLRLSLPRAGYPATTDLALFYERLAPRLRALPEVTHVAASNVVPMNGYLATTAVRPPGFEAEDVGGWPEVHYRMVSAEYFSTMGIPVVAGRAFSPDDRRDALAVAIVTRTMAQRYWPTGNAIGSQLMVRDGGAKVRSVEVVGITGDVRHLGPEAEAPHEIYIPLPQVPDPTSVWLANNMYWVIRTTGSPLALANAARREVADADPKVAASYVRGMDQWVSSMTATRRFNLRLMTAFAAVALLLAAIGVYAVNAAAVASREREIGVRAALGATDTQIRRLVLREGLVPVAAGTAGGALLAAAVTRWLATFLFGVETHDAATFGAVCALILAIGALAVYVPTRALTRIDPLIALRSE